MAVFDAPLGLRYPWISTLHFRGASVFTPPATEVLQMSVRRVCSVLLVLCCAAAVPAGAEETIVFLRHGEKPSGGLGQLTCQGLNRSLALPSVLIGRYGTPDYVYAPNPNVKMNDPAGSFYYVRPLATIEPTAIRAGISVNTSAGFTDIASLQTLLIKSSKANATIFVAWEHAYLVKAVQNIMNQYGGGQTVPAWTTGDYDSLYVVRVTYTSTGITARFDRDSEDLNGQPTGCPS